MILDYLLMLDNPSATLNIAGSGAAVNSGNVIDLLNARDMGISNIALPFLCRVGTAFVGAGTLQILIQGSVDNSTFTTMDASRDYALAELTAGARLHEVSWPGISGTQALPRYIRARYVNNSATAFTAGTLISGFLLDRQDSLPNLVYPIGVTIYN